jgi:hypothetical protein
LLGKLPVRRLFYFVSLLILVFPASAWATAPLVFNDLLPGSNAGGAAGRFFNFKLANPTLANNITVCRFMWSDTTATISITDDKSDTWSQLGTTLLDPTGSGYRVEIWGTASATGMQKISPTLSAVEFNFNPHCHEIAFASLTVDQSWTAPNLTGPTIAAGSKSTAVDGDLILQYVVNGDGGNGLGFVNLTTSIVVGTGFTLLAPNRELGLGAQYQVQTTHGAINPTMTFNQVSHDAFDTIAVALEASGTGTAPSGMYVAASGTWTIPNGQTSPRVEQIPCNTGDLLVFEGSTDPVNFDLYHGNTNGTTGWTDSDGNTFAGYRVSGHTTAVGQIVSASNVTCTNPNTRTVSIAFTDGGAPDPIQWFVVRGAGARDTSLGSAVAIGTGGSAGCTSGICWATVNQSSKAASNTTCANSASFNTGIKVTPSTAAGMVFAGGFTGSGPTCDVQGSSAGITDMAPWFQTEDDLCCGLLSSSSIYDFGPYSSTSQITIQDNWANSAASAASGAGYVVIAFQASVVVPSIGLRGKVGCRGKCGFK